MKLRYLFAALLALYALSAGGPAVSGAVIGLLLGLIVGVMFAYARGWNNRGRHDAAQAHEGIDKKEAGGRI